MYFQLIDSKWPSRAYASHLEERSHQANGRQLPTAAGPLRSGQGTWQEIHIFTPNLLNQLAVGLEQLLNRCSALRRSYDETAAGVPTRPAVAVPNA
jgi:hypothetical protein